MARLVLFANTYGSGPYGSQTYNASGTTTTNGGTTTGTTAQPVGDTGATTTSSNLLTNTGFDVGLIVGLAALTLLVAMIVRIWKRPTEQ